jgi:hypothetical protein
MLRTAPHDAAIVSLCRLCIASTSGEFWRFSPLAEAVFTRRVARGAR